MHSVQKQKQLQRATTTGFTIVELLIVIVVIAILAAITIIAYNGIRTRTIEATLKSDLQTAAKLLENELTTAGAFPASSTTIQGGKGLAASGGNTLTYTLKPYGYCVSGTNPALPSGFTIRPVSKQVESGTCDARATTLVGVDGASAYVDGNPSTARLACAYGIATSSSGNLYIGTDSNLAHIRKVTPTGDVSTLATLWDTRPYCPKTQVVDSQENVYFTVSASGYAHQIWKVTPAGAVTSFAGASTAGYNNDQGAAARFSNPGGLAIDKSDNIYVADYSNRRIRKIDPAGNVTTIAGSGTSGHLNGAAASAQFSNLNVLALDDTGNLFIGDSPRVRMLSTTGTVSTIAGSGAWGYADGPAATAEFQDISFLVVDKNGVVYSADYDGAYIRKIIPNDTVSTVIGNPTYGHVDGSGSAARFRSITGMKLDQNGQLWVSSSATIRKVEL